MSTAIRRILSALAFLSLFAGSVFGAFPEIENLGTIDPATISGDGSTVVGIALNGEVWRRGTPGYTSGPSIFFWETSYDGSFFPNSWTPHPSWEAAGDPNGMPWPNSFLPYSLSSDGATYVGTYYHGAMNLSTTKTQPARYSAQSGLEVFGELGANPLSPPDLGPSVLAATSVSADGSVVAGTQRINGEYVAFRWTQADGLSTLAPWFATDVSPDGSTILGVSENGFFKWTADEGVIHLGGSAGNQGVGWWLGGISSDNSRIVGGDLFWSATTGSRPLEEVLTQWYGLDLEGWGPLIAVDISDDGRTIVGSVNWEGWLITLPQLGDANGDDIVDGGDYTTWADNFLESGRNWQSGDFTGDGIVDAADYTMWADHYSPAAATATLHAVPEPSALALAGCGVALIAWQRSARRRV